MTELAMEPFAAELEKLIDAYLTQAPDTHTASAEIRDAIQLKAAALARDPKDEA